MAEHLLDQVRDLADGQIDFEGQKLAELLATVLLSLVGVISFVAGYVLEDIRLAVYIGLGGAALVLTLVVPPWPWYNRHPLSWLSVSGKLSSTVPRGLVHDEKTIR
ncbi:hypothetical protein NKR23_g3571 [Pleurostoma richardsiae]|uniref:Signal peptidase complex subunit 1 n=1 Tax=Pleurostoma richardsiae TaxID=41990 RepID=A0AA38RM65_9PEZI|nr:hypothetical protein NKR23_g3571 [Pleurostoma richardsiae]